jgi:hypothetical protein
VKTAVAWLAPLLGIAAIVLAILLGNNSWEGLPYKGVIAVEAAKVAGALFVVALFLERSLAVLLHLIFAEDTVDMMSNLRVKAAKADFNSTDKAVATSRWEIGVLEEKKDRVRLGVGFVAAVLIASAGVRTFTGLLDFTDVIGNQRVLLDTMDILLTAGLLAGGSNGLAILINVLRDWAQAERERTLNQRAGLLFEAPAYPQERMARAGVGPVGIKEE